jgi:predicted DNA-binding transcriptional regulator YafY
MTKLLDNPILSLLPTARSPDPWLSTSRIIELLKSRGYEVRYPKQALRSLQKFEEQGLVLGEERGRSSYWQRREGVTGLAKGSMQFDEALALQILRRFSARQLPEQILHALKPLFEAADTRLQTQAPDGRRHGKWSRKVASVDGHFQLTRPKVKDEVFQGVTDALFSERLLSIHYNKLAESGEKPRRHTVMPLGLVEAGKGLLYLAAKARSKDGDFYPDPVLYRLDRMTRAKLLDEDFGYPADFSLESYVRDERALELFVGRTARVTLKMSAGDAQYLVEQPLSADQSVKQDKDGGVTLAATVALSFRFEEWLLAKAAHIEVASPKSLRDAIKNRLAAALARYR